MLIKVLNPTYKDGFVWIILKARNLGPKGQKKAKLAFFNFERQFLKNGLITFFEILHGDAN